MEQKMLKPGTVIRQRYIIECTAGAGGFGITYRARDPILDVTVAVKEYRRGTEKFLREARIMARFRSCANIVYVYDFFEENGAAYIVMEFLEGETLKERIGRQGCVTAREAAQILIPVLKALETVHRSGMIHRDVAPDNIYLLRNGRIKLFDFGNAMEINCRPGYAAVKHGYSPPEQYHPEMEQGLTVDLYAAGACLYRMLTGMIPPPAPERKLNRSNPMETAALKTADRHLTAMILKAMQPEPKKRYADAAAFRKELERYLKRGRSFFFLTAAVFAVAVGTALFVLKTAAAKETAREKITEEARGETAAPESVRIRVSDTEGITAAGPEEITEGAMATESAGITEEITAAGPEEITEEVMVTESAGITEGITAAEQEKGTENINVEETEEIRNLKKRETAGKEESEEEIIQQTAKAGPEEAIKQKTKAGPEEAIKQKTKADPEETVQETRPAETKETEITGEAAEEEYAVPDLM